jgi:hypothetical protein
MSRGLLLEVEVPRRLDDGDEHVETPDPMSRGLLPCTGVLGAHLVSNLVETLDPISRGLLLLPLPAVARVGQQNRRRIGKPVSTMTSKREEEEGPAQVCWPLFVVFRSLSTLDLVGGAGVRAS